MRICALLLAGSLLAGCSTHEAFTGSDPEAWLDAAARPSPVRGGTFSWTESGEATFVDARGPARSDGMAALPVPGGIRGSSLGTGTAAFGGEYDVYREDDGIWYEGVWYPGGVFLPDGDFDDYEEYGDRDVYYVTGGVIVIGPRKRPPVRRPRPRREARDSPAAEPPSRPSRAGTPARGGRPPEPAEPRARRRPGAEESRTRPPRSKPETPEVPDRSDPRKPPPRRTGPRR